MLNEAQESFLKGYNGSNAFVHSLKGHYEKKGSLSPKQIFFLQKTLERETKKTNTTQVKETVPMAKKQEERIDSFFNLEPIEEPREPTGAEPTPNLDHIEEMLAAIAGKVVSETISKANAKLDAVIAKAEKATLHAQKSVLHVRVNGGNVAKLSSEACEILPDMLLAAKLKENILLKGPAGSGKTTAAKQLAEALELPFGFLCLSAGVSETWLYGRQTPQGFSEGEFSKFYRNGGVFLLDEFDAADSNLLLSINTALANGHLYNPILGEKIERHENFICVAAANTFGLGGNGQYTGRNRLDAATLDRFTSFVMGYAERLEEKLVGSELHRKLVDARKKLEERNAPQIISTRGMIRAKKLIDAGMTESKAFLVSFAQSWPQGLAKEIGLISEVLF